MWIYLYKINVYSGKCGSASIYNSSRSGPITKYKRCRLLTKCHKNIYNATLYIICIIPYMLNVLCIIWMRALCVIYVVYASLHAYVLCVYICGCMYSVNYEELQMSPHVFWHDQQLAEILQYCVRRMVYIYIYIYIPSC